MTAEVSASASPKIAVDWLASNTRLKSYKTALPGPPGYLKVTFENLISPLAEAANSI
jgi:hypothetical protein